MIGWGWLNRLNAASPPRMSFVLLHGLYQGTVFEQILKRFQTQQVEPSPGIHDASISAGMGRPSR